MRQITIKFSNVGECPVWCFETLECGHINSIGECGQSGAMGEPPGNCPCEHVPKALSGSGQNSTAAFEKWWDTGVHGWGNEKLAEYKLAKDAWLAALSCGETNKQSTPCKKMISCGLLYDSELCDNGFRECYE